MYCSISIESLPNGTISFRAHYPDGYNTLDPAHKLAHLLTSYADTICERLSEPELVEVKSKVVGENGEGNFSS